MQDNNSTGLLHPSMLPQSFTHNHGQQQQQQQQMSQLQAAQSYQQQHQQQLMHQQQQAQFQLQQQHQYMNGPPLAELQSIANQFVADYYQMMSTHPMHLYHFYGQNSSFSMRSEDDREDMIVNVELASGRDDITHRFIKTAPHFKKLGTPKVLGIIVQRAQYGLIVSVDGEMRGSEDNQVRRFMQTFLLASQNTSSYFVANDVLRIWKSNSSTIDTSDDTRLINRPMLQKMASETTMTGVVDVNQSTSDETVIDEQKDMHKGTDEQLGWVVDIVDSPEKNTGWTQQAVPEKQHQESLAIVVPIPVKARRDSSPRKQSPKKGMKQHQSKIAWAASPEKETGTWGSQDKPIAKIDKGKITEVCISPTTPTLTQRELDILFASAGKIIKVELNNVSDC